MKSIRLLVVGSANVDLVTQVPRCPRPGETLIGTSFKTVCGGKGSNQAVAAARLGAATWFLGCVGDDAFGGMQRTTMAEGGVDVSRLKVHPSEPTGTAVIFVADTGQNSIAVVPAANYGILPADIEANKDLFEDADVFSFPLEIPFETIEAALDVARTYGVLSIMDAGPAQAVPETLLRKTDIVSPNETEAEAITGVAVHSLDDAKQAAAKLRDMGANEIVLKLGAMGSLYHGEETIHVPAFDVTPVDTTAAGDAFTGALGLAWRNMPRTEALRFANAVGGLATTVAGAQPSMPTRESVERLLGQ